MVQPTSRVLKQEVVFDNSNVTSLDWVSNPVLRFAFRSWSSAWRNPRGAGKEVMGATAAAIANAFFDANRTTPSPRKASSTRSLRTAVST
jgi:nicotinate dehydrogenase subunit B